MAGDTKLIVGSEGRQIACVETGDPAGMPVVVFHGLPGSRLQQNPDPSIASARRARVIHFDRPGFGRSSPAPGRTLASCADDVTAISDQLGIREFAVAGISGGGPFALATAALLRDRVTRVALVSSVGPPGSMREGRMSAIARAAFYLAPRAAWLMRAPMQAAARLATRSPERFVGITAWRLAPDDRRRLARDDILGMLTRDLAESLRQGVDALLTDLALEASPWNLPLDTITAPVALWHGNDDWVVPPAASRHLAAKIPRAHTHFLPSAGHFMVFDRWAEILDWLVGPPFR